MALSIPDGELKGIGVRIVLWFWVGSRSEPGCTRDTDNDSDCEVMRTLLQPLELKEFTGVFMIENDVIPSPEKDVK
jgi:hypothetical protein